MNTILKEITVEIENLILNPNNPRFAKNQNELKSEDAAEENEEETYRKMILPSNNYKIPELADNIRNNGFLGFDKLFVKKINKSKYIVIEGNRRITAIKYLLKNNRQFPKKYIISKEVEETLKKIPCIDLTGWEDSDIHRMLGLRHYDSVKDWAPLPGSFNLFREYINEYCKTHKCPDLNNDESAKNFIYDQEIINKIGEIYSINSSAAGSMILTYRVYLQVKNYYKNQEFEGTDNVFSIIKESISKQQLSERFGFSKQTGTFSDDGLEIFIDLFFGKNGKKPVITEVSRGESNLRDYAFILSKKNQYYIDKIEIDREKAEDVKSDLKSSERERNLRNTLIQIRSELEKINLKSIDLKQITDEQREIIQDLQNLLNKLRGAAGGKL